MRRRWAGGLWIFQDGNLAELVGVSQTGPIVSFLPMLLIGILFGLAMDCEVFLVSRMRERFVHTGDAAKDAIVTGYGQSGRVVTAAAIIMIAVFGAFILTTTRRSSRSVSRWLGVLADAFIVRLTLVPAVMALLGRHAWRLPRRFGRLLPDLDIEGEKLTKTLTPARAPRRGQ